MVKRVFSFLCCLCLLASLFVFSVAADDINISLVGIKPKYETSDTPPGYVVPMTGTYDHQIVPGTSNTLRFTIDNSEYSYRNIAFDFKLPSKITVSPDAIATYSMNIRPTQVSTVITKVGYAFYMASDGTATADYVWVTPTSDGQSYNCDVDFPSSYFTGGKEFDSFTMWIKFESYNNSKFVVSYSGNSILSYKSGTEQITDKIDEQTEKQKGFFESLGDKLVSGFMAIVQPIIDGIKALFLPEDGYISEWFEELQTWLDDHLGALYYPISVVINFLQSILDIDIQNPSITFPKIEIMGNVLLEPMVYDFDFSDIPTIDMLYGLYLTMVDCIIAFWLIKLCTKKLQSIMGGDGG